MRRTILIFSAIAAALLILVNLRRLSLISASGREELWTTVFAIAFIAIGLFLSRYLSDRGSTSTQAPPPDPAAQIEKLGITQRELEVLRLIEAGHSNLEISRELFISESTVKTHVSNVLMKLDARRRTHAVQRAKELGVL